MLKRVRKHRFDLLHDFHVEPFGNAAFPALSDLQLGDKLFDEVNQPLECRY
jgi:hypothetical protein